EVGWRNLIALGHRLRNCDCGEPQRRCLPTQEISPEQECDLTFEIAHLLLIDVVGYSKLLVNEQIELLQELNRIVRATECFRAAESRGKLNRLQTGHRTALVL